MMSGGGDDAEDFFFSGGDDDNVKTSAPGNNNKNRQQPTSKAPFVDDDESSSHANHQSSRLASSSFLRPVDVIALANKLSELKEQVPFAREQLMKLYERNTFGPQQQQQQGGNKVSNNNNNCCQLLTSEAAAARLRIGIQTIKSEVVTPLLDSVICWEEDVVRARDDIEATLQIPSDEDGGIDALPNDEMKLLALQFRWSLQMGEECVNALHVPMLELERLTKQLERELRFSLDVIGFTGAE